MRLRSAFLTPLLAVLLGIAACSGSARDALADARAALGDGVYDDALAAAEAGLAASPDEVTAWGLELVKLEALARAGRGDEAMAQLEEVAAARPASVPPTQYAATADQLRVAGQGPAAIQVLDLGAKRFPANDMLAQLITASSKGASASSDELDMLRTLGYVE